MLILLPPSETKTRPVTTAAHLELEQLIFPELNAEREKILQLAARTAGTSAGMELLKIPASQPELLVRMQNLESEPAAPALEIYSGVLYEALGEAWKQSFAPGTQLLVASALFGLVDAKDLIPAYRLSAGSELSGLGKAATWWKPRLKQVGTQLLSAHEIVVDCRSGAYKNLLPLRGEQVLEVSPVAERKLASGKTERKVISHDAKKYRGLVAKALLESASNAVTAQEVVEILRASFGDNLGVELSFGAKNSTLTIVDYWQEN